MKVIGRVLGSIVSAFALMASLAVAVPASAATDELPNTPNKPTFSRVTTSSFRVNWTTTPGGNPWSSYAIEFSADGVTWSISSRTTNTQPVCNYSQGCYTAHDVTGAPPGSTVYVRVANIRISDQQACADCTAGYSAWSQVASITTNIDSKLSYLRVKGKPGPYNFTVEWAEPEMDPNDILQYDVQYRKSGSSSWIDAGGEDVPSFTFQYFMRLNTKYQVRVRVQYIDLNGDAQTGKWTSPITVTTAKSGPPSYILDGTTKVTKKTTDRLTGDTLLTVRFNWSAPLDTGGSRITKYEFRTRTASSTDWERVYNTGLSRTVTIPGFNCHVDPVTGPKYYYVFLAINAYNAYGTLEYNSAQIGIYTDSPRNYDSRTKRDKRCTVTQIY